MKYEGMSSKEAVHLIRKSRPQADPWLEELEYYSDHYLAETVDQEQPKQEEDSKDNGTRIKIMLPWLLGALCSTIIITILMQFAIKQRRPRSHANMKQLRLEPIAGDEEEEEDSFRMESESLYHDDVVDDEAETGVGCIDEHEEETTRMQSVVL